MKFLKATATAFSGNPNVRISCTLHCRTASSTVCFLYCLSSALQLITIFGQSAGSGSVSVHLVAPRSWGLFERAIMESTGESCRWMISYNVV